MRVVIPLVFEWNAEEYAEDYCISVSEAPEDFRERLTENVSELAALVEVGWLAMQGHVTSYTVDTLPEEVKAELLLALTRAVAMKVGKR